MTSVFSRRDNDGPDTWRSFRLRCCELANECSDGVRGVIPKHGHVYNSGHDPHVYLILEGQVKLVVNAPSGRRCLLAVCTRGDVVGECSLVGAERRETAVALRRTVVRRVAADRFLNALSEHGMLEEYLAYKSAQVLHQQKIIVDMVTMESERRLAACLLGLSRLMGTRVNQRIHIDTRLTQEELAEMVGTTRSRVGYFLKGFQRAGLVEKTRTSTLLVDEHALVDYISGCRPSPRLAAA